MLALQGNATVMTVIMHSAAAPQQAVGQLRDAVRRLDPRIILAEVRTLDEHLGFALAPARGAAVLLSAVGVFGLLLAGVGVYGLLASVVGGRTREIGVRVALGATPGSITTLVFTRIAWAAGCGVALGVIRAYDDEWVFYVGSFAKTIAPALGSARGPRASGPCALGSGGSSATPASPDAPSGRALQLRPGG